MSERKALSEIIRQVRKARVQLNEYEEQLYDFLEDKYDMKEELEDLVREIVDNVDMFEDASTVESMLTSCSRKVVPTRTQRRNAGKKTKEEVIQTVKERRGAPVVAPVITAASDDDV